MTEREAAEGEDSALARLPSGRHGLAPDFVSRNQRDRLTAGVIAAVVEHGYHEATITQISAAAGVSRRTFYKYFGDKEECFLDAFGTIERHLLQAIEEAGPGEPDSGTADWPDFVRARLRALLETLASNPDLVRFTMIVPQEAGRPPADRYGELLDGLQSSLVAGVPAGARVPSPAAREGMLGAIAGLIVKAVRSGRGTELPDLLSDLQELVLIAFLGDRVLEQGGDRG